MLQSPSSSSSNPYQVLDIVQDGNEFYVFMSLQLFGMHSKARTIRIAVNSYFCFNVFGCAFVEKLPDNAVIKESAWTLPWFQDWKNGVVIPVAMNTDNREEYSAEARNFLLKNAQDTFRTPIRVACALTSICWNLIVKLYEYSETDRATPPSLSGTWRTHTAPTTNETEKCVSLMMERKSGQLRLLKWDHQGDTNLVVNQPAPPCITSDVVKDASRYVLMGYNPDTRTTFEVAWFVSPVVHKVAAASAMHFLSIDAQRMPRNMKCSISIKRTAPAAMCTYALRGGGGGDGGGGTQSKPLAKLINYWQISFTLPSIDIQTSDTCIIIVETDNVHEANNLVCYMFGCTVSLSPGGDDNNEK